MPRNILFLMINIESKIAMFDKLLHGYRRMRKRKKHLEVYQRFKDYTMIPTHIYCENLLLLDRVHSIPGAIVECGTWKGGMIAGIASILGDEKEYWLFDSFEGLPPTKEIDGTKAIEW